MEKLTEETIEALLRWYRENKRILPWRGSPTPYETWVSEIMLQQTRVETVKPYFNRFLSAYPTVKDLAKASEEEVFKLWEGLGYYSRARNLLKAAKIVDEKFGELPKDKAELEKLPGIGAYTAGAILSIAFGVAEPAVDGNVLRVVSRLTADPYDTTDVKVRKEVADKLRPLMKEGETSDFTQALFEIGALVCLPDEDYRCEKCPLTAYCAAYREGKQSVLPVKVQKKAKKEVDVTVLLLRCGDRYAIKKRPDKGLLAGLYELPNIEGECDEEEIFSRFGKGERLPDATHVFTHVVWRMRGYGIDLSAPIDGYLFVTAEEIRKKYSLPSAFSAYKKFCR